MRNSRGVVQRPVLLRSAAPVTSLLLAALLLTLAPPAAVAQSGPNPSMAEWTVLLFEDFEDGQPCDACQMLGNPTWSPERGNSRHGTWSAYSAGGGDRSVEPPGPYPNRMQAWMIFGPFDLSQATAAELEFYYWTQLGPRRDQLFWGVSSGDVYCGESYSGDSGGWRHARLDLSSAYGGFLGQPQVWIGFEFRSDETAAGEGAYVDHITLRVQNGARALPVQVYVPLAVGIR